MEEPFDKPGSRKNFEAATVITNRKVSTSSSVSCRPKSHSQKSARHVMSFNRSRMGKGIAGNAALFLLKVAALETVRRFSRARCPIVWGGMQALQVLCYPPFKWIQRWAPLRGLLNGMQSLSRPLLVLSIANAFSDQSGGNATSDPTNDTQTLNDSRVSSESHSELSHTQPALDTRVLNEAPQSQTSTNWLPRLYAELEKQGISLPERLDEDELYRFYISANGDFSCLLSSVKKTIRWRETYSILCGEELEMWSKLVFWHGYDASYRPCLVVRVGLACTSLSSHERPRFVQAIVSQVEHGILHLVDIENPRISVLVDCEGLSPMRFPMQLMRSCSTIFQDHFPNRLGILFVIQLPPFVRVIVQTFIQVLKPSTRQKVRIQGEMYQKVLLENFPAPPSYLGGNCTCSKCSDLTSSSVRLPRVDNGSGESDRRMDWIGMDTTPTLHPPNLIDMHMNGNCDQLLRTAVVGILMFWVLIAFVAGIYNPESL
ncbi:hypothetical protein NMG60_11014620 [Bertholletia excelsa]